MGFKLNGKEGKGNIIACLESNLGYELQEIKIHLTKRCNSNCIMCEGGQNCDPALEISREQIRKIEEEAKQLGLRQVKYFGGEPTLRRDLVDLVDDCNSLGISSHITSNGLLIDQEKARQLVAAGLKAIVLSLDSPFAETHDYIRGVPESYEKMMKAIAALDDERRKQGSGLSLQVNCVVMKYNWQHLPELLKLCAAMKVDKVSLNPITPDSPAKDGCQKDLTIHFPTREEVVAYNRDIIPQMLADGSAMKFGLTEQHLQVFGVTDEEIDSAMRGLMVDSLLRGNLCFKPWYFANINQDSKLIACNHVKECPEFPIGDLKEHSILELWNSEKYKAFRQKCKTPLDSFKSCSYCCFPYAIHNQKLNEKLRKNGKE